MLPAKHKLSVILAAMFVLAIVFSQRVGSSIEIPYDAKDGRHDMGVMLSGYAGRGYTIATTEAGLLPLYSRWRAVDTWGLNDKWIAHHGGITEEYLDSRRPDIIMFHAFFSPENPPAPDGEGPWFRQVMTLYNYAVKHNFTLAAVFGISQESTHYYYVRSDLPENTEIVGRIRSMDYVWRSYGRKCRNYVRSTSQDQPKQVK